MPSVGQIKNYSALSRSLKELKSEVIKNTEQNVKVSEELKKLNELKKVEAEQMEKKIEKELPSENRNDLPLAKYQPNELTLSQMLMRKLDIV